MEPQKLLQLGIDRLGLQGEHSEHALVDAPEWLAAGDPVQRFQSEGVFA